MARPTDGLKHVDRLQGPAEQKRRLRLVLETLQGRYTVEEASALLGIKPARFHELRGQVLAGGLAALAPRKVGRPKRPSQPSKLRKLEEENRELKEELWAMQVREELALTMPHVLRPRAGKKIEPQRKKRRRRA